MSFLLSLPNAKLSKRCIGFLFLLCCFSSGLCAQTSQPSPQQGATVPPAPQSQQTPDNIQRAPDKIAVQVKTVSVLATVRDRHGKIISDLKKEDFAIEEDGHPQTINYFARESDLALRLGLLVDTSLSQRNVLDQERTASYSFLDHLLRENKDLAFIIHFDKEVELLQDFTPSRPKLQAALQHLETPQFSGGRGGGGNNGGGSSGSGGSSNGGGSGGGGGRGQGRRGGAGTLLYDAIYLASDELMSKQQGRKALIVLSDGVDHGSKETMAEAIATAQRSDTIIYSILFADEDDNYNRPGGFGMGGRGGGMGGGRGRGGYPPREERPDGKKILEQISEQTGGRLFKANKKDALEKIYAEIDEDLRNQYSLAYTPDKGNTVGYHKIHLAVAKQKDLTVTARDGYYFGQ
jgi:VWFA-related protein